VSLAARILNRIRHEINQVTELLILALNRLRFLLFFKRRPLKGEYCNSKRIRLLKVPPPEGRPRPYLVIVRCGASHGLIDDGSERKFDLALNWYERPADPRLVDACEYSYTGGLNKYKAARQFLNEGLSSRFRGFMFLDDDLEITYSQLNQFLEYCSDRSFRLVQPSLSSDSFYSHKQLLNTKASGWRTVEMVEVMCPYFSQPALKLALKTFDLSYSTWGLDHVWPQVLDVEPIVVDEITIRHTRPVGDSDSAFYQYMRAIGASPKRERQKLRNMSKDRIRAIATGS
jgi:hypothetical protein